MCQQVCPGRNGFFEKIDTRDTAYIIIFHEIFQGNSTYYPVIVRTTKYNVVRTRISLDLHLTDLPFEKKRKTILSLFDSTVVV